MKKSQRSAFAVASLSALALAFDPGTARADGSSGGSSGGSHGGGLFKHLRTHGSSGGSSGGSNGGSSGGYVAMPAAPTGQSVAYLNVRVPADAKVYLQDQLMTLAGEERRFVTPELSAGVSSVYSVKVEVVRDGQTLSKTAQATISAGQVVEMTVTFDSQNTNELAAKVAAR
jgi:uncharacterized protein (TIGR03000 family)